MVTHGHVRTVHVDRFPFSDFPEKSIAAARGRQAQTAAQQLNQLNLRACMHGTWQPRMTTTRLVLAAPLSQERSFPKREQDIVVEPEHAEESWGDDQEHAIFCA